jgi:hypothetical protein
LRDSSMVGLPAPVTLWFGSRGLTALERNKKRSLQAALFYVSVLQSA